VRVRRPDEHDAGRERRDPSRLAAPPHVARLLALQRSAGNQAVARALKHHPKELDVAVYDTEPGPGTVQQLAAVVKAVTSVSDLDEAGVTLKLSEFDGDDAADLVYSSIESLVEYLGGQLKGEEDDAKGEKDEKDDSGEDEDPDVEEGVKTAEGQTVGKITFAGDTYHGGIKKAIIRAIGVKKLSFLVYGDKTHHNFNLWFEEDGEIFADTNSPKNNKGVETGFRWDGRNAVEFKKATRKQGRTKERKGNKKRNDW
jgi:hypothetical protein